MDTTTELFINAHYSGDKTEYIKDRVRDAVLEWLETQGAYIPVQHTINNQELKNAYRTIAETIVKYATPSHSPNEAA